MSVEYNLFRGIEVTVEPKMVSRYILKFQDKIEVKTLKNTIEIKEYQICKSDKPKAIKNIFGCISWQPMEIEFVDLVAPSTSQDLYGLLMGKKRNLFSNKPLFTFNILCLDPTGTVVEDWLISVKDIKSIDFGNFDYRSDNLTKLRMVIQPFDCILNY